jgi:hypothetical protein
MVNWNVKPNTYNEHDFIEIPAGAHRVQITRVFKEKFKSGKTCYEVTLKVSGYHGKLWCQFWDNPNDVASKNAQQIIQFFDSFQIENRDLARYKDWVGKNGAVYVNHYDKNETDEFDYEYCAKVAHFITGKQRDTLPAWKDGYKGAYKDMENPISSEPPF